MVGEEVEKFKFWRLIHKLRDLILGWKKREGSNKGGTMRRKKVRKRLEIIWKLFPYNYMEIISEQIFHTSKEVERKERMWSSKELNSIIAFLPRVSYYEK